MAATAKDDATAKGDDDSIMEKDFGQEAKQDDATAKSDDTAKASGKTSGKAEDGDDAAKNLGKDADGEAESDMKSQRCFCKP